MTDESIMDEQDTDLVISIPETEGDQETSAPVPAVEETEEGFFGLPPEMRENVYRNLLVTEVPHRGVHPNILRTSKRIWNEAKGFILHDNVIHIGLSLQESEDVKLTTHIHTNEPVTSTWTDGQVEPNVPNATTHLPNGKMNWPRFLASARKLCIRITISSPDAIEDVVDLNFVQFPLWQISHALCSLGSFFENQGHKLDELTLDFVVTPAYLQEKDGPADIDGSGFTLWSAQGDEYGLTVLQKSLWQLGRIGRVDEHALKISGLSPNNEAFVRARIMSMPSNRRLDNINDAAKTTPHNTTQESPSSSIASGANPSPTTSTVPESTTEPEEPLRTHSPQPPSLHPFHEYKSETEERERIHALVAAHPKFPDLMDRVRALTEEIAARTLLLTDLNLSNSYGRPPPSTKHIWPRQIPLIMRESKYDDLVNSAHYGLFTHIETEAIGPREECNISWWCDRLEERLDDFHSQLFDGRLPFVASMLKKESFQDYFQARNQRLFEHRRLQEREKFRVESSDGGMRGLPTHLFSPNKTGGIEYKSRTDASLYIKAVDSDTPSKYVLFLIRRSTKLGRLMDEYCKQNALSRQSVDFLWSDAQVRESDTPLTLQMEERATLVVRKRQ